MRVFGIESDGTFKEYVQTPFQAGHQAELQQEWFAEAARRARELDSGQVQPISAEEVRRKARELLR